MKLKLVRSSWFAALMLSLCVALNAAPFLAQRNLFPFANYSMFAPQRGDGVFQKLEFEAQFAESLVDEAVPTQHPLFHPYSTFKGATGLADVSFESVLAELYQFYGAGAEARRKWRAAVVAKLTDANLKCASIPSCRVIKRLKVYQEVLKFNLERPLSPEVLARELIFEHSTDES